jgi:hypothetical protein
MHIEINDNTSLCEIKEVFSDFYPYLKIEFYKHPHKKYQESDESDRLDPNTTLGHIKRTHYSGILEIQPLYRVADVEREFQERFGLSVQVFRKNNEAWEQTTGMDILTLKDINEIGRNSSDETIIEEYEEGFDEIDEKPEKLL